MQQRRKRSRHTQPCALKARDIMATLNKNGAKLFDIGDAVTVVLGNTPAFEPACTLDTAVHAIKGDHCQIIGSEEWFDRLTGNVIAKIPKLYLAIHSTGYRVEHKQHADATENTRRKSRPTKAARAR